MLNSDKIRVYLSLPISGMDEQSRRQYAARTSGTLVWMHEDWEVINPFHIESHVRKRKLDNGDWSKPTYEELMLNDIIELHRCQKAVFCPGWELSDGCKEEYNECLKYGIEIGFWDDVQENVLWKSRWSAEEDSDQEDEIYDYLGLNW